jgi:LysM domain
MSAMPALDWPEDDPATWPEDDAASRAAAARTFPVQLVRTETARHYPSGNLAARDLAATGRAARGQAPRDRETRALAPHGQAARNLAVRGRAAHDQTALGQAVRHQAVRGHSARGQVVHGQASRGAAAPAPLRLTRRGRIVVAAAAALLAILLSLLATGAMARATSHSAPSRGADRNLSQVVVLPGQSLWSVAQTADPNADPRQVMQQIIELNSLAGDVIQAGQRLWVPRG